MEIERATTDPDFFTTVYTFSCEATMAIIGCNAHYDNIWRYRSH